MKPQSPSEPTTAPPRSSNITDFLPTVHWIGELLYHCIRDHQERVRELQASTPGYDPQAAHRAIEKSLASLDYFFEAARVRGTQRDIVLNYWDRGLQSDTIRVVRSGFAEKIRHDPENWSGLIGVFKIFVAGSQYGTEDGTSLYGGASLCMHIAQEAGRDPHDLIRELAVSSDGALASAT